MSHPIARSDQAVRLLEHTLIDVCDTIGADSFSLVETEVTFVRRPVGERAGQRWTGRLGDWLVPDGAGFWRIVSDQEITTPAAVGAAPDPAAAPHRLASA